METASVQLNQGLENFIYEALTLIMNYNVLYIEMEKAMAPHSSTLAWKIPWMEEPGRLQTRGS